MRAGLLAICIPAFFLLTSEGGRAEERIVASGIRGALVICGGGRLAPEIFDTFMELAGGERARVVVIPTADPKADELERSPESILKPWRERGAAQVGVFHARSRELADDAEYVARLREATGVWISGGLQSRLEAVYTDTRVERELHALLGRGGVVGGSSAGAAVLSRVMIRRGNPVPEVGRGLGLLPGAIVDQHFLARSRRPRLVRALADRPGLVGYGIDEETALVVRGRRLRVLGTSTVTVCLAASESRPAREIVLESGHVADLIALRRAARARARPPFPAKRLAEARVDSGTLVIVGGGRTPAAALQAFIRAAGGPEALIICIPSASPDPIRPQPFGLGMFRRAGALNVRALHARRLEEVESEAFLGPLSKARGVWFDGGRQWRLVDAYADTKAHECFLDVLRRGGVIGGSSAGASIQAGYLVRGHPLGNQVMMAEGYERGLGFLPAVAVDQHFTQRNRFADLAGVVDVFPQLLGIGIDESTAIVVRGRFAEVVGRHSVHFYDRRPESGDSDTSPRDSLAAGRHYDLVRRRALPSGKVASF